MQPPWRPSKAYTKMFRFIPISFRPSKDLLTSLDPFEDGKVLRALATVETQT